jgi:uracil-DNA glycosylase family 4
MIAAHAASADAPSAAIRAKHAGRKMMPRQIETLTRDPLCRDCKLGATAQFTCLLGAGPTPCDVMIIGEAPGRREDASGKAFVGSSGGLLDEALIKYGFDRDEVFISNAVHCRPPGNRTPTKGEIKACKKWLDHELAVVKPKFVLLLGNVALQSITEKPGIQRRRGKPIEQDGRIYLPTFHPSFILRDPSQRPLLDRDFSLFRTIIGKGEIPREDALDIVIVRNDKQVDELIEALVGTVSIDIETTCLYPWGQYKDDDLTKEFTEPKINTLGFGTRRKQYILPVSHRESPWSPSAVKSIVKRIDKRLADCYVVAHNGKFDFLWKWVHFGVEWYQDFDFDTMLAHYMLDENSRHGLKGLAQKFCGAPDWDVDADTKKGNASLDRLSLYQAHDLYYTRKLRFIFGKMLDEDENIKRVFEEIMMPCARLFVEIEYDGVCIDMSKMDEAEKYLKKELDESQKELKKYGDINWGSPKQLGELLFTKLKIPVIEKTPTGQPSTSESVIKRIDHPIAKALLRFRGAKQQLSFFIEGWKPYIVKTDDNHFLHPSFKLHGTVTGRLSCEHPNLQQVPRDKRIRSLIGAPPGEAFGEADLSQIELRIAAELAQENTMLEMFRTGRDVHWITALRELERGGGGDHVETILKTTKMYLMRHHLPANGVGAKILLGLWGDIQDDEECKKLLQLASEEWLDKKARSRIGRQSDWIEESIVGGGLSDMAKKISKGSLRALREYAACVSSPQERKPVGSKEIEFSDAMQILSRIGSSIAEELQQEWDEKDPSKLWKELRKKAKAISFGFLFGMYWRKFKMYARDNYGVDVTDEQAQDAREFFFDTYKFENWHNRQRRFARLNGYVVSLSGRKRRLPEALSFDDSPERREAERQAINSPVQGFANEINLMSAIQLRREFTRDEVKICATVHDAILYRCPQPLIGKVTERLLQIMSHPDLFDVFDIRMSVPICAEAKIGNWSIGTSYDKWKKQNAKPSGSHRARQSAI